MYLSVIWDLNRDIKHCYDNSYSEMLCQRFLVSYRNEQTSEISNGSKGSKGAKQTSKRRSNNTDLISNKWIGHLQVTMIVAEMIS